MRWFKPILLSLVNCGYKGCNKSQGLKRDNGSGKRSLELAILNSQKGELARRGELLSRSCLPKY